MADRTARFREVDLKRVITAMEKSGVRDYRIDIMVDGTMSIFVGGVQTVASKRPNSCDDLLPR